MTTRVPEGAGLLVAGHGFRGGHGVGSVVHTLGRIGEALLATTSMWRVRRLSGVAGERHAPSRASLKRHIDELVAEPTRAAILVMTGVVTTVAGEPALVTGPLHRAYPDDATLPLSWIRDRLREARAAGVLVALAASGDGDASDWLEALRTERPAQLVAVDDGEGAPLIDALLAGICGDALDPKTGTVTLRSMSEHLARVAPRTLVQGSLSAETFATVPPLGNMRLSVAHTARADAPSRAGRGDDLVGVVLPGRFRIERPLARGSFGVVYRARQLSVERDVAVKVLQPGLDASSEDGRLFVAEIQSVGRLDHPNVVRIHQADVTQDRRLFFAMELLVGRDLQQIVEDERVLEPERAIELCCQLLAGLGAVHAAGLVHADIKPANAFVVTGGERERVVLIDFGLARLKPTGRAADSAGGTPAYMAPEQLHSGRVDPRSDLFSAALVLVTLLTGWRRRKVDEITPPLELIADEALRAVLARALAVDPAERYQTAADLAAALTGNEASGGHAGVAARPPFRHLAPFTERDRARLHGRERDVAALSEQVLFRRGVVYTAPSGVGKTSLLRAGLVPRLEELGARAVYHACRARAASALAAAVWPGAATVAEAVTGWHGQRGGKLVLIVDQLEAALSTDGGATLVSELLAFDTFPADADISVVLCIREDFLARLLPRAQELEEGVSVMRLGPLDVAGARAAVVGPLTEQRLSIEPELLDVLLEDLQRAAASIGVEMGWGQRAAVYPPHLQLACSILFEALGAGEATLTLAHYRRLGGLEAIVGEHLDRVLDTELDAEASAAAREVFLALVTTAQTRAFRHEAELVEIVGARHGAERTRAVLETLAARGLLVRVRPATGDAGWELVHDSLVPRVLAWIDRRDLARRRAVELVRYHLRRSRAGAPSLLARAELRELREHEDALAELEAEWQRRGDPTQLTPASLIAASRRAQRRLLLAAGAALAVALCAAAIVAQRSAVASAEQEREQSLRDRDMGRLVLALEPFDWDEAELRAHPVPRDRLPRLSFTVHEPAEDDPESPGAQIVDRLFARESKSTDGLERAEIRGGDAFLVISGRGPVGDDCPPSVVPLHRLGGYARRYREQPVLRVKVPTCAASRRGMIEIPAGATIHGGVGEPPSAEQAAWAHLAKDRWVTLPAFSIDRTEVTNRAFAVFAEMEAVTGIAMPGMPDTVYTEMAEGARNPVTGITFPEARAYCRFMGKALPTSAQWLKAMRGGLVLPGNRLNPMPRRNLPWGTLVAPNLARLHDPDHPGAMPVGTYPDVSPYGVLDLAGNVQEWTETQPGKRGFRVARGGNWGDGNVRNLVEFMAIENPRPEGTRVYVLGMRCAVAMPVAEPLSRRLVDDGRDR